MQAPQCSQNSHQDNQRLKPSHNNHSSRRTSTWRYNFVGTPCHEHTWWICDNWSYRGTISHPAVLRKCFPQQQQQLKCSRVCYKQSIFELSLELLSKCPKWTSKLVWNEVAIIFLESRLKVAWISAILSSNVRKKSEQNLAVFRFKAQKLLIILDLRLWGPYDLFVLWLFFENFALIHFRAPSTKLQKFVCFFFWNLMPLVSIKIG